MGNNDPHYLTTMEPDPTSRVLKRQREPFSDFTNSFNSLSSSSLPINPSQLKLLRSSYPSSSFIKTPAKRISTTTPSNPSSSPPSPLLSTPPLLQGSIDVEAPEPNSIRDSQRRASTRIKDKGKAVDILFGSAASTKISNNWDKSGSAEGASVPTTKALTVPLRKRQLTEEASHVQVSVPTLASPRHLQHINGNTQSHNRTAGSDPTRHTPKRRPLTDCTNTSHSLSSSSLPIKPNTLPSSYNKTSAKRITSTTTSTTLNTPSNSSSPPSPLFSTPSLKSSSLQETSDVESSKSISIKYSRRRRASNQRKDKGKAVAIPVSSAPSLKISNTWKRSGRVEGVNLPKAKALTVPLTKKHRSVSSGQDVLKDPVLQDFIEKQNAYFKEIDEFELSEEEVGSADELD
ncbi:hypothetical protein RIF29_17592 [Crotalaria pallida]|uniref:Sororin C-terminal region domain-containing protein n=1 Tax=Crotalaria pallida TaxID=3830 RepID=A0AAN9FR60_CROPI